MVLAYFFIFGLLGYLLGSVPCAVLVARRHGVNILEEGSGNPGATNVKRVLGAKAGNLTFLLDFLKGGVAAYLPMVWFGGAEGLLFYYALVSLLTALVGHSYSIFIGFRGGKGVATSMGGLLILTPIPLLLGLATWVITFYSTRFVSLASIVFAVCLPFSVYGLGIGFEELMLTLVVSVLILFRHRGNIERLVKGEEHRFSK